MREFSSLKELILYFDDERICYDFLEKKRWKGEISCIHCSCTKLYRRNDFKRYSCSQCKKVFSITSGTIFEKSRIPLSSWYLAIYLFTAHRSSVSALQMTRDLKISAKSAWFMHHRIMEALKVDLDAIERTHGIWEIDEVYIGPLKHRLTKKRLAKVAKGTGFIHMIGILGLLNREKGLFGMLIPNESTQENIQPIVRKYLDPMSILITDGSGLYMGLKKHLLIHESFIHTKGQFGRGDYHTNTIEGAFRHFKDAIRGSYKQLTEKHLQRYWDEFCFRYNTRKLSDVERFELVFETIARRLTYKELVSPTKTKQNGSAN